MADEKPKVVEDVAGEQHRIAVDTGTGKTAQLEGAQAKEVHNVG
jgi:hypothetical protein